MDDDLIRRSDAEFLLGNQFDYLQTVNKDENPAARFIQSGVNWSLNTIKDIPAVDAVEVVRCASCRFADYVPGPMEYLCRRNGIAVKGDEFCSRGQRREDGDA